MGIGLTFEEYASLRLTPPAGADRAFQRAAQMEREEMFPMNTLSATGHLRSRGYDCKPAMLELLVKNGVVTLVDPDVWTQADVDAAAEHFEECEAGRNPGHEGVQPGAAAGHAPARFVRHDLIRVPHGQTQVLVRPLDLFLRPQQAADAGGPGDHDAEQVPEQPPALPVREPQALVEDHESGLRRRSQLAPRRAHGVGRLQRMRGRWV